MSSDKKPPRHWKSEMEGSLLRAEDLYPYDWEVTIAKRWVDSPPATGRGDKGLKKIHVQLNEFDKPWILNVVNGERLATRFTWDPDKWIGQKFSIYAKENVRRPDGKIGLAIRIRLLPGEKRNKHE